MEQKLGAVIEFSLDLTKADQQIDKFAKNIDRKLTLKPDTFTHGTREFVKSLDNIDKRFATAYSRIFHRVQGFIKKKGFEHFNEIFENFGITTKEGKQAYVNSYIHKVANKAFTRYKKWVEKGVDNSNTEKEIQEAIISGRINPDQATKVQELLNKKTPVDKAIEKVKKADNKAELKQAELKQKVLEARAENKKKELAKQQKTNELLKAGQLKQAIENQFNGFKQNPVFAQMREFYKQQDKENKKNLKNEEKVKKQQEKDDKKRKDNFYNALLMKWGKLGAGGFIASKIIQGISYGFKQINNLSKDAIDETRLIQSGATGADFLGASLAGMEKRGIKKEEYKKWKAGLFGQIGAIKLGMGNAAPFTALGVNPLDNPDKVELAIQNKLKQLDKSVSYALANQLGISFDMWSEMVSGQIDRTGVGYSNKTRQALTQFGRNLDTIKTGAKTTGYNIIPSVSGAVSDAVMPGAKQLTNNISIFIDKNGASVKSDNKNADTFVQFKN